jgi:hypothetical protein
VALFIGRSSRMPCSFAEFAPENDLVSHEAVSGMEDPFFRGQGATIGIRRRPTNGIAELIWLKRSAIQRAVTLRRSPLGAEKTGHAYIRAVIDCWITPALNEANPPPVPWTQELFTNAH